TGNVGRHLVQAQLLAGATVVVPSRRQESLDALGSFLDPSGPGRFVPVVGDITDDRDATRIMRESGPLDGAVASLGRYIGAPSVLQAPAAELEQAFHDYAIAHLAAARALLPGIAER